MHPFNKLHNPSKKIFLLTFNHLGFLKKISSSLSDAELVQQYKRSTGLAVLGDLYQRYMDLVYGVCLKYLKEPEEAQDAVMAIFEELITKLQKHEVENFKSWLYTLAKNHCLMRLRSQKRAPVTKMKEDFMQSDESGHLDEVMLREENFKQLEYCMGQLENGQRKVIEAFYLQGKCYNQISSETGIEWKAIRSYIQNGRRNLKLCMERQGAKTMA